MYVAGRWGWSAAVALLLAAPPACAQRQGRLQPDERVRVAAPAAGLPDPIAGTVVKVHADTLTMYLGARRDSGGVQVSIPIAAITRLDRSAGPRSRVTHGLLGGVLGTGLGAVAGHLHYRMQSYQVTETGQEAGGRESLRTELTVAGAVIGGLVGALRPGERWRRAPVLASFAAGAGARGARLGLRISF